MATRSAWAQMNRWIEQVSRSIFIWPAVLVLLFFSIFPLVVSLYLSFARVRFARGGVEVQFVGLANYHKLLFGSEQAHLLGVLASPSPLGWLVFLALLAGTVFLLVNYARSTGRTALGLVLRTAFAVLFLALAWLAVSTLNRDGRPGTLMVTLVYVYVGIACQYLIGLGLALLTAQDLPGRRFFRVAFMLPMMITPVGVAY
ncbi:transporter, partial [Litorilinea aerophila]